MEAFKSILLKNSSVEDRNIISLLGYLNQNAYDTDSIVEDMYCNYYDHEHSFIFRFCYDLLQNESLYNQLKSIVNNYVKHHYSESFKDMDYALSNYYELMGVNTNDGYYFTKYGIGKFERYCFAMDNASRKYVTERDFWTHFRKLIWIQTPLSKFDYKTFPLRQNDKTEKRKQIHTVLKNCYENKYWYDIQHDYLKDCQDVVCESVASCSCTAVQNIRTALEFHSQNYNHNKVNEYFANKYKFLVKDFHHLMLYHLNTNRKSWNDNNFQKIHQIMSENIQCNLDKCKPFVRNNRNRQSENNIMAHEIKEEDDMLEYQYNIDLLDNIHCFFIHSFDTGFRLHSALTGSMNNLYSDMTNNKNENELDFDCNDIEQLYVDNIIKKLKSYLADKRKKLSTLGVKDNNKFVTQVANEPKIEHIQEMKQIQQVESSAENEENARGYSFGIRYYYWPWFKDQTQNDWRNKSYTIGDWYIEKKYNDLKQEMLHYLPLKEFNGVKLKSTKLLHGSSALKRMKCDFYYHGRMLCQLSRYGIPCGVPIKVSNIMVVLFYTDYTTLSTNFSGTFRRLYPKETDEELKERNSCYWNWGKILRETVELYGNFICKSDIKKFYHGVSFMYFDKFVSNFCCPTSTTKQLQIATMFSCEKGIVLELSEFPGRNSSHLTYFNCSLLSCYGNEDERLFFGGMHNLQFVSIYLIETNQNMMYFVKALALFSKVVEGWQMRRSCQVKVTKLDYKIVRALIKQRLNPLKKCKLPEYIVECFNRFCNDKYLVRFTIYAIHTSYPEFFNDFVGTYTSKKRKVLLYGKICSIFNNVRSVKCYDCGTIDDIYVDLMLNIVKDIDNHSNNLEQITVSGKIIQNLHLKHDLFGRCGWEIALGTHRKVDRIRLKRKIVNVEVEEYHIKKYWIYHPCGLMTAIAKINDILRVFTE